MFDDKTLAEHEDDRAVCALYAARDRLAAEYGRPGSTHPDAALFALIAENDRLLNLADKAVTSEEMTRLEDAAMAVYRRICKSIPQTLAGALALLAPIADRIRDQEPELMNVIAGLRAVAEREGIA